MSDDILAGFKSPSLQGNQIGAWVKAAFVTLITMCAFFALPWRLVTHTRWGERALVIGCPVAALIFAFYRGWLEHFKAWGDSYASVGAYEMGYGEVLSALAAPTLAPFVYSLSLVWLARLLLIWQVERKGPRPLSWSMGGFPGCGTDFRGMSISNFIALVAGLWVQILAGRDAAFPLYMGAAGGQLADFATWLMVRWQILDLRDQAMAGESMAAAVAVAPADTHVDSDFAEIFGKK